MFTEIFRFELRQQLKGPLFWIFLALFFIGGAAFTSSPAVAIGSAVGNVHINAPVVIAQISGAFAFLGTLFVVVFVTGALLRDFDQRTAETIFSTPVSRGAYLGGRFAAGFLTALAIVTAALLGTVVGTVMPWVEAARLGPMMPSAWAWSFGVIVLPDMLFVAALLFALSAATRSLLSVFVGVVALIVLRSVANALMSGIDSHFVAGLLDPYGGQALAATVRYWTAHAYNTQLPPFTGVLLGNRVLWLAVSVALFAAGFSLFRADREGLRLHWWPRRKRRIDANGAPVVATLPVIVTQHDLRAQWRQLLSLAVTDTVGVLRGVLFPVMLALGLALLTALLLLSGKMYGTTVYPVTYLMVQDIRGAMSLFLLIVLAFYAGELVWRDRNLRTSDVNDSLPVPDWIPLAAQGLTLVLITVVFLLAGAIYTIGYQLIEGYTHLQPGLYASGLALDAIGFVLIGMLALVLQVLANNKFLGYLLFVAFLVVQGVMGYFDFSNNLYQYAGGPPVHYSDLNGYGHFLAGALWFDLYWVLFALVLMVIATLFRTRGTDRGRRWRTAVRRLCRRPLQITLAVALVGFAASGSWIYYNTHILNTYTTADEGKKNLADYEKLYSKYAGAPQPRIVAVKSQVAIYPYQRKLRLKVHYTLTNKHDKPIDTLYVNWNEDIPPKHLVFPAHTTVKRDTRLGFSIYKLDTPLAPGASMSFDFDVDFTPQGFHNDLGPLATRLVHNGTFVTNQGTFFPSFGYNRRLQLTDKKDRRKYGLKPVDVPRVPPLNENPAKRGNNYLSSDSDWITFDTVVSTAADQTAIAPGALVKSWTADGRRYFHYRTQAPILNFYAYLSGKWKIRQAQWRDVTISVYYNPAHPWNVDDLIASAKDSLDYYTTHFGPYQFKYLRIIEVPNYSSYAQSFAGTVAFSESMGFIAQVKDKSAIDYPFYVAAHEIAHQWWAHQVIGAYMQGATLLSESLAQYSALMVMKHHYGENKMRRFLKYELDHYLARRIVDKGGESPLARVEGQAYIRYRKASVIFYALQDYIGEDVINGMLKHFLDTYRFKGPPYPTSEDLIKDLKLATDPKWNTLIDDSFWKITLYDNRVVSAKAKKLPDGKYQVTMKLHAAKYYADAKGKQTRAKMTLPVAIGVFARAPDGVEGNEPILYLEKRHVTDGDSTLTLTVDGKPYEVGIDPYNELVDRNSVDNRTKVALK